MKRKQDYIPYYIGCRCLNTWFPSDHPTYDAGWVLRGYRSTYEKCYFLDNEEDETWTDSIKPILRRLESITHEEWNELEQQTSISNGMYGCNTFESYFVTNTPTLKPSWVLVNEMLMLLRKKCIDIDGLIKNGLALDSATLPKIN